MLCAFHFNELLSLIFRIQLLCLPSTAIALAQATSSLTYAIITSVLSVLFLSSQRNSQNDTTLSAKSFLCKKPSNTCIPSPSQSHSRTRYHTLWLVLLQSHVTSSPTTLPLPFSTLVIQGSLLLLQHFRHTAASGPLHLLCALL